MVLPTSAEQLLENALPVCAFRVQMCGGDSRQGAWTFRGAATARHHAVCRSARARSSIGPPSRRLASPCESQQRRVAPVHRAACVPQTRSASWVEYGYRKRERGECGSAVLTAHQDLFQGPMFAVLCAEARSIRLGSVRLRRTNVARGRRGAARRGPAPSLSWARRGHTGLLRQRLSLRHRSVGLLEARSQRRLGDHRDTTLAQLLVAVVASASFVGVRHRLRLRMI